IERGQRREAQPADDDPTQRNTGFGARAARQDERYAGNDGADHGHEHRAQADVGGLEHGLAYAVAAVAQLIGELDDEDAVLGHDADQHDEADLAVDVEAGAGDQQREHGAGEPQRDG